MSSKLEHEFADFDTRGTWPAVYMKIKLECAKNHNFSIKDAKRPDNRTRNRYRDVSPYDHSRVKLQRDSLDYINASLIHVPQADRTYILTQGPLPHTSGHFWLMVWEQNTKAVLMLNRIIERGQLKCNKYYPAGEENGDEDEIVYEDVGLKVEYLKEEDYRHFVIRTLKLEDITNGASREILQFHYTDWPDFGVPHSPSAFLSFLYHVRESGSLERDVGPPVIHCSAGIGRSGTFCMVDSSLVLIEQGGHIDSVDIRSLLLDMRQYRMGLIQTHDQLRFTYLSVIEGAHGLLGDLDDSLDMEKEQQPVKVPPPKPPRYMREIAVMEDREEPEADQKQPETNGECDDVKSEGTVMPNSMAEVIGARDGWEESVPDDEPPPLPPRKRPYASEENNVTSLSESNGSSNPVKEEPAQEEQEKRRKQQTEVRRRNRDDRIRKTTETVERMKLKQQQSEKWRRRRSLVQPVTVLGVALSACIIGYVVYAMYYR